MHFLLDFWVDLIYCINDNLFFIAVHFFIIPFVGFIRVEPSFRFERLKARLFFYSLLKLSKATAITNNLL
jgi:hypothetical protein